MTKWPVSIVAVILLLLPSHRLTSAGLAEWTNLGIEVPGSVYGVLWYPGNENSGASVQMSYIPVSGGKAGQPPKTQVWLLNAKGSVIPPKGPPGTGSVGGPGIQYSLMYHYDHATVAEAVAVAVMIEGQFFVKALPSAEKSTP